MKPIQKPVLFALPEQDVGTGMAELGKLMSLKVADQTDKYAPHFLHMKLNKLEIWFSFDEPIAFAGRTGSAVLRGGGHNRDMHSYKAGNVVRSRDKRRFQTLKSKARFCKLLADEIKKEIVHSSSEIMSSTLGA